MARCRRVVSSRRAAPLIKRRRRENRRCACGGGASDAPRHQGWVGPRRSERGFINLSIGVVRRHVRFGVVHEGYNHEPGAKGVVATLHACESLRRTGSSGACGDRRGKGGAIASRVVNRTSGALKQYEYSICEITKTGLLPPGVINTGEFVHHRAWVGCVIRTPRRAFLFIGCYRSLANWSRARADVPRVTTGAAPAHAPAQQLARAQLQRDASPRRAKLRRAPARATACAVEGQPLSPVAVVLSFSRPSYI